MIDARRGEVYAAVYDDEMVCPFSALLASLGETTCEFISQTESTVPAVKAPLALAGIIARIAEDGWPREKPVTRPVSMLTYVNGRMPSCCSSPGSFV